MDWPLEKIFTWIAAAATVLATLVGLVGAIRSGALKSLSVDALGVSFQLESGEVQRAIEAARRSPSTAAEQPFEIVALAKYYNHALLRANISFWFSLIFAAIGFGVIIFAFATHNAADIGGTIVKAMSGTVIDAVSALFFVQSTNAQKSMGEFFEKLRVDRMNADARAMLADITNPERRDEVRTQLVLKYAAIDRLIVGQP